MNEKAYLVLSVGQLRQMLRDAQRIAKKAYPDAPGRAARACFLFEEVEICRMGERLQISSYDVSNVEKAKCCV